MSETSPDTPSVCIVEDENRYAELYESVLQREGVRPVRFDDPGQALEYLQNHRCSVLITEWVMPRLSGIEFIERCRRIDPFLEVIAATRFATVELLIKAIRGGVSDVLLKPLVGDQVALAVRKCLRRREAIEADRARSKEFELFERTREILSCLDTAKLFSVAAEMARTIVPCHATVVCDRSEGEWRVAASTGMTEAEADRIAKGAKAFSALSGASGGVTHSHPPEGEDRMVWIPFQSDAADSPLLTVFRKDTDFLESELDLLRSFQRQLASAFDNARRFKDLEELSFVDDLTGLHNDRYLASMLEKEIGSSSKPGQPFALLFVDIDHFKAVVDTHGHLTARRVLIEIGRVLKISLRESDVVVRYGGDEFTALLSRTAKENAILVAERLRRRVSDHVFLAREAMSIRVSVSIGVACYPDDGSDKQKLLDYADKAMFKAKSRGRNTVYLASELSAA